MEKQRSLDGNAYYFGVPVKMLSVYFKVQPPEIHLRIKTHFEIKSTASLNTIEFEDLMNNIRVWSNQELKLIIPLPNEEIEFDLPIQKRKFANSFDLQLAS